MKRLIAAAIICTASSAYAEEYTDTQIDAIAVSSYICGMQRMKIILHKPVDPLNKKGEEVCATVQLRAKYHPEDWQWLYQQQTEPQGNGEDQLLR